jgi:hypothetical protein
MMADRDELKAQLEAAAAGLLYTSEGDAPFEYVELGTADGTALMPDSFARLAGIAPGTRVEEVTLERFFAGHIEASDPGDPHGVALRDRYRTLRETLRGSLDEVRVFRVGNVEIRCYAVGRAGDAIVGLATTAWET